MRLAATIALALALPVQAADLDRLRSDLSSDDGRVVLAALKELKAEGRGAAPAVPAIVELLKSRKTYPLSDYGLDNVVYPAAFEALKSIGVKSDDVLRVTMDYFKDGPDRLGVKPLALDVIAGFGEKAAPAIPLLAAELARTRGARDQRPLVDALARIGPAAAPAAAQALIDIATRAAIGSDRIQALSALNKMAPRDRRVLRAYADLAWKRPGSSEDAKVYGLFSAYLSGCGELDREDLVALAGYMDRFTQREAAEDRNPPGHLVSTNPSYLAVAKIFASHPESASLAMPSLAQRIRRLDLHMKDYDSLLDLAGDFGTLADPLAPAIYERASSRESVAFGSLKPRSIRALERIGTPSALEAAKRLAARR